MLAAVAETGDHGSRNRAAWDRWAGEVRQPNPSQPDAVRGGRI